MEIMEAHRYINLSTNIMFFNKHLFFNTIFKHIKFGTTENVPNTKIETLYKSLLQVIHIYAI